MLKQFFTVTHCRDILCKTIQTLQGEQIQIIYAIPIYFDKPQGTPTVEITEHEIKLTFNLKQQQNVHQLPVVQDTKAVSLNTTLPDKPCT